MDKWITLLEQRILSIRRRGGGVKFEDSSRFVPGARVLAVSRRTAHARTILMLTLMLMVQSRIHVGPWKLKPSLGTGGLLLEWEAPKWKLQVWHCSEAWGKFIGSSGVILFNYLLTYYLYWLIGRKAHQLVDSTELLSAIGPTLVPGIWHTSFGPKIVNASARL